MEIMDAEIVDIKNAFEIVRKEAMRERKRKVTVRYYHTDTI